MTQSWIEAARRYREIEKAKLKSSSAIPGLTSSSALVELETVITSASRELGTFVNSEEGRAAMELLGAAKRHLIFGEETSGGYALVFFIDENGIRKSHEPHGTWTLYSKEKLPEPKISKATSLEAVRAAVCYTGMKPTEVVTWLRGEIDKIAEAVK